MPTGNPVGILISTHFLDMEFTKITTREDIQKCRDIWKNVFIDNDTYLDRFFRKCFPYLSTYALIEEGEIRSIASLIPLKTAFLHLEYLYGVATPIEFRGRSYSRKLTAYLLDKAKSEDIDAILTRPASRNLFGFYRAQGFNIDLKRRLICQEIPCISELKNIGRSASEFKIIKKNSGNSLDPLYHRCLKNAEENRNLTFELSVLAFAIDDFLEDSGMVFFNGEDYFFTRIEGEMLHIESTSSPVFSENLTTLFAGNGIHLTQTTVAGNHRNGIPEIYGLACLLNDDIDSNLISDLPPIQFLME